MTGYCENCALRETCTKAIGQMFGFCNTDYVEESEKDNDD